MTQDHPLDDRLSAALGHHQAGRLMEAQFGYQAVLADDARNADALHLLGVTYFQQGAADKAIQFILASLLINPDNALAHTNAGNAFQLKGLYEESIGCYDRALGLAPHHADAAYNRGMALRCLHRDQEALGSFDQALVDNPSHVESHFQRGATLQVLLRHEQALLNFDLVLVAIPEHHGALEGRGNTLQKLGRPEEALLAYGRSLALWPGSAETLNNQGLVLEALHRSLDAVASFDLAIAAEAGFAEAHFNRGNSLFALARYDTAVDGYDRALGLRPRYAEALNNRGNAMQGLGQSGQAIASYNEAIDVDQDYAEAFFNRGVAQQSLGQHEAALTSYDRALQLLPGYAEALNNRGNTLQSLEVFQEAQESYQQAYALRPDYGDAHWNEALCRLKTGDFDRGWEQYEWRWQNAVSNPSKRSFLEPLWLGAEDLRGKRILIHAEQGFGDTIQFCRYIKLVAALGATVTLEVDPALSRLLRDLEGMTHLVSPGEAGTYDYHCPLLSLPLAFGTKLHTIPVNRAYLTGDASNEQAWHQRLGERTLPRVGLAWAGNKLNQNDPRRSIQVGDLAALIRPDLHWFSLQKEASPEDDAFLRHHHIPHHGQDLTSFSETATLISQLDVVISVDTAVAHLAAAMGKPTWILLPHVADFRWLLGRRDSPWYPSARLFRQPGHGDWAGALRQVAEHLGSQVRKNGWVAP